MNFNENDLWREKTKLLYLRISKLAKAKVLLKLEFDTEDQVLFLLFLLSFLLLLIFLYQRLPKSYNFNQSPTILEFDTEDQVLFTEAFV